MAYFFESSNTDELIQRMFAHIRTQAKQPQKPGTGFMLSQIMHLHINLQRSVLTPSS